jgi:hypothetical protein
MTGGIGAGSGGGSVATGSVVGVGSGSVVGVGSGSVVGVASAGSVPVEVSTGSVAVEVPSSGIAPTESPLPASVEATSSVVVVSATAAISARASAAKPKIQRSATLKATVAQRPGPGTLTPLAACRETDAKLDNSPPPPLRCRW